MASVRGSRTSSVAWKITQVLGGAILFRDYVAEAAMCTGESMLPTLKSEGDVILIEKVSLALGHIDRGDVIVTVSPTDPAKLICKRVLGLENDIVSVQYGGIFPVNHRVPQGHLWIEGDNALQSRDSRDFGAIPYGLVRGRAICKIWPLRNFGQKLARNSVK